MSEYSPLPSFRNNESHAILYMATKQSTANYIQDQLSELEHVATRKMFGEYALYCDGKVVGLICDNTLFVKITDSGKAFVGSLYEEGEAYKGAKPSMKISNDQLEDHEWLSHLIRLTADSLPAPKPKRIKK